MADKYYRLVKFVVDICPQPQRKLFFTLASASTPQGQQFDLDTYLRTRQQDINSLLKRKVIRQDQYDLIFPVSGTADQNNWDLTLVSLLLTELFRSELKQTFPGQSKKILKKIDDIRSVRNDLQHKSNTAKVFQQDFDVIWNILEDATLFLAQTAVGSNNIYGNQMKNLIDEAKLNNMPDLGDYLRQWYTDMYIEMKNELLLKIEDLQDQLTIVGKDTKESQDILLSASVKRKGRSGAPTKHMRTLDPRIQRMKERLAASMKELFPVEQDLLEDEIAKIIYHLREYHRVVISTCDTKRSFQSVLAAIKRLEYQQDNCLEVTDPLDWKVISSEDAQIVVFRDPFGKDLYDETKARTTLAEIDGIIKCSKADSDTEVIDVVIISEKTAFEECQHSLGIELPEEPVVFSSHTTQMTSIDLTKDKVIYTRLDNNDPVYKNITDMTNCYIRQNSVPFTDQVLLKKAKDCFKMHKILVLCGGKKSGKTTLALALLSDYREESRLILTEPGEFKHVNLPNTCVVIEDIGGKDDLEATEAKKWLKKFDLISAAAKDGKLNVIITIATSVFDSWNQNMPQHPLFDKSHVITMPDKPLITVKQENSTEIEHGKEEAAVGETIREPEFVLEYMQTCNVKLPDDEAKTVIQDMCVLPSGEVLLIDQLNRRLKKLNNRYNVLSVHELVDYPVGICSLENNEVLVIFSNGSLYYVNVSDGFTKSTLVDLGHPCSHGAYNNNGLFIIHSDSIFRYNVHGKEKCILYSGTSTSEIFKKITLNKTGSIIYTASKSAVHTFDLNGKKLFSLSTDASLPLPIHYTSLFIDKLANLLLCMSSDYASKLIRISPDGKRIVGEIALLPGMEKQKFTSVCLNTEMSLLFFAHGHNFFRKTNVSIYACKQSPQRSVR